MPIKHSLIVCHPEATSFTMAIAHRYAETVGRFRHQVEVRDLYRLGFDPLLKAEERPGAPDHAIAQDVVAELGALAGTDIFVLVYPLWFGARPAAITGYIERVFGAEFLFSSETTRHRHPLLAGKRLVSLTVSGSMSAWLDEKGVLLSLRNLFEQYLADIFDMTAVDHVHLDGVIPGLPDLEYRQLLLQVEDVAKAVMANHQVALRVPPNPIKLSASVRH